MPYSEAAAAASGNSLNLINGCGQHADCFYPIRVLRKQNGLHKTAPTKSDSLITVSVLVQESTLPDATLTRFQQWRVNEGIPLLE